ncbi:hypothetical protein [Piscinibacter gummiphilus]|uniref:Uncharacterized protein n=1 Tax=Piscinibacter gummiphilus TaxID=946333 RepID=A0ABZ0CNB5_9BURK|nr:hypothetical protein [Piscinibacter gummiphilus]WOB06467.1 hypothetical protein RXV79_16215 [Piscinibacter gummiphilus]
MNQRTKLVQNDNGPSLIFTLANAKTGVPLSIPGATAVMHLRQIGSTGVKEAIPLTLLPGIEMRDWRGVVSLTTTSPYDVAGSGGRVRLDWTATSLDTPGSFEGEVEVTLANGRRFTVDRLAKFAIRPEVA